MLPIFFGIIIIAVLAVLFALFIKRVTSPQKTHLSTLISKVCLCVSGILFLVIIGLQILMLLFKTKIESPILGFLIIISYFWLPILISFINLISSIISLIVNKRERFIVVISLLISIIILAWYFLLPLLGFPTSFF